MFDICEVTVAIRSLKNNKSSGRDHILNEYIKHSHDYFIYAIVDFFNLLLLSGFTPLEWSVGIICPIYKGKGDTSVVDNYRGITLLSCFSKMFTSCLNNRLAFYINKNRVLGEEQAGFRQGYSTRDHVFLIHALVEYYFT